MRNKLEKTKNFLIVSYSKYPDGNAGAVRQHALAKLLKLCGHKVTIVSMGDFTCFDFQNFEGVDYISLRGDSNRFFSKLLDYYLYKKRLHKIIFSYNFSDIIFVNGPTNVLFYLKKLSLKKSVNLYHDSVEWYSPEEFSFGKLSRNYRKKELLNTKWIDDKFKVISISTYLDKHFKSRGIYSTVLPVIMDVDNIKYEISESKSRMILLYAGSIGKKDYVREMLEGIGLLDEETMMKVEFRIIGVTVDELKKITEVDDRLIERLENAEALSCYGRLSRSDVLNNLQQADFTVLLRPSSLRYAKAGFPTKVVESLATATPVICNITSDLGKYLIDGANSIIVKECSAEEFSFSLKRAISNNIKNGQHMKSEARKTAEKYFDYKVYEKEFCEWLEI